MEDMIGAHFVARSAWPQTVVVKLLLQSWQIWVDRSNAPAYRHKSFATSSPDAPQMFIEKTYRRTARVLVENKGHRANIFDGPRTLEVGMTEQDVDGNVGKTG